MLAVLTLFHFDEVQSIVVGDEVVKRSIKSRSNDAFTFNRNILICIGLLYPWCRLKLVTTRWRTFNGVRRDLEIHRNKLISKPIASLQSRWEPVKLLVSNLHTAMQRVRIQQETQPCIKTKSNIKQSGSDVTFDLLAPSEDTTLLSAVHFHLLNHTT